MIKSKIFILLLTPFLFFCNAHKDQPQPSQTPTGLLNDYIKIKSGNYWIYEQYYVDITDGKEYYKGTDSVYVISDTVINNITYSRISLKHSSNTIFPVSYYGGTFRDSMNYLKDIEGYTIFSAYNFKDTLAFVDKNEFYGSYKMDHKDSLLNLPAGTFSTYDFKGTLYAKSPYIDPYNTIQYTHTFYGKGVGIVKMINCFLTGNSRIENRLIRYYIQ